MVIDRDEILKEYRNLEKKFDAERAGLSLPEIEILTKVIPCSKCEGGYWKGKKDHPCFSCNATGVEISLADKIANFTLENPRAVEWMEKGKGGFQTSLLQQFHKKGYLSQKQMSVINKRLGEK